MQTRIFLIGFIGSGKTTVGSQLARKLAYEFVDMDQVIEETAGMSVPGIFEELGEEVFRSWEHKILLELCQKERVVIATGGGAPCHGTMMSTMKANGITIYIKLIPTVLKDRLTRARVERPLIRGKSEPELLQYIKTTLEAREAFYSQANYIVDGDKLDPENLAKHLKEA